MKLKKLRKFNGRTVLIIEKYWEPFYLIEMVVLFFKLSGSTVISSGSDKLETLTELIKKWDPAIIISDFYPRNSYIVPILKSVLKQNPNLKILFVSDLKDLNLVLDAVHIGAGFINRRSCTAKKLKDAIDDLCDGKPVIADVLSEFVVGFRMIDIERSSMSTLCGLTPVEIYILETAKHWTQNLDILAKHLGYSDRGLRTYTKTICRKLGINHKYRSLAYAVDTAVMRGILQY